MITIVIAEDHHVVRQGLKLFLEMESDFRLVGEAGDGLDAVRLVEKFKPDLLLLDLMIPKLHGLEVTRQLKQKDIRTKIIILSMHADEPYVIEALRNGADGYVLKNASGSELVKAMRKVLLGRRYLSGSLSEQAIARYLHRPDDAVLDPYETLSNRERVVLQLAAEGCSNAEIGARLFISPRTAETHRANLMQKLNLHSQTEVVRFAIRKKIITA